MTFALITEGALEHGIIKHIITKYFKNELVETEINQIQPRLINGKQDNAGSWNEVLKYCERQNDLKAIFVENDYLIIQLGTDQSQQHPFNISHTKRDNSNKSDIELHADIVDKLKNLISPEILNKHGNKILFAICIRTIECWLLPIYYPNNHKSATTTCLDKLNTELRKKDIHILTTQDKNSVTSKRTYDTILKNWKRKQDIINASQYNIGFNSFIQSMDIIV